MPCSRLARYVTLIHVMAEEMFPAEGPSPFGGPGGMWMSRAGIVSLCVYLLVVAVLLLGGLVILWPAATASDQLFPSVERPPIEVRMLLLSFVAGALGSTLHSLNSIMWFVGNRTLMSSWALKYTILPVIGGIVGLFIYIAIRGGILRAGSTVDALNPYTIVPFIALAGLFCQMVLKKLQQAAEKKLSLADPRPGRKSVKS
jgi:hypothetical protein